MILFQQSLIFGKLNISHHNFIHGNVFKSQGPFSSLSCVAVLKYFIICSMQPFYPSKFPQPDQSEASYSTILLCQQLQSFTFASLKYRRTRFHHPHRLKLCFLWYSRSFPTSEANIYFLYSPVSAKVYLQKRVFNQPHKINRLSG